MEFQVIISRQAEKELRKIGHPHRSRIIKVLVTLGKDPFMGKRLRGFLADCWSVKAWPYRIIYQIERKKLLVLIVKVGHRQGIYN